MLDHDEDVEATQEHGIDVGEVDGEDRVGLRGQELSSGNRGRPSQGPCQRSRHDRSITAGQEWLPRSGTPQGARVQRIQWSRGEQQPPRVRWWALKLLAVATVLTTAMDPRWGSGLSLVKELFHALSTAEVCPIRVLFTTQPGSGMFNPLVPFRARSPWQGIRSPSPVPTSSARTSRRSASRRSPWGWIGAPTR
jgi:hypothetical protein